MEAQPLNCLTERLQPFRSTIIAVLIFNTVTPYLYYCYIKSFTRLLYLTRPKKLIETVKVPSNKNDPPIVNFFWHKAVSVVAIFATCYLFSIRVMLNLRCVILSHSPCGIDPGTILLIHWE